MAEMKIRILEGSVKGADCYFIEQDIGSGYSTLKPVRKCLGSAMDRPIDSEEEMVGAMCKRILELENGNNRPQDS